MKQDPFGQTFTFRLALSKAWLSMGAGWAAMAGAMTAGWPDMTTGTVLQLISLWLLVDPILGTLWALAVEQGLWRHVTQARLTYPARHGFSLPYAQPDSIAGRLVMLVRRYQVWWQQHYWPAYSGYVITFGLGLLLALLMGLALQPTIFWLVVVAIGLTLVAGHYPTTLASSHGGRLPTLVQLLLPWLMGAALWSPLTLFPCILAVCYGAVYLGGLRLLGNHHRAEWLFFGGQIAAIVLLLGLRVLPGAAVLSLSLLATLLLKTHFDQPAHWLTKAQPYLVIAMLTAGISLGVLGI